MKKERKKLKIALSFFLVILGIFLLGSSKITGFGVLDSRSEAVRITGILLLLAGALFLVTQVIERKIRQPKSLEVLVEPHGGGKR